MVMSNDWREAKSLLKLESEIQEYFPGTTTWEIGDDDHADNWSDHNPNECCDVVCGKDILSDGGLSLRKLADHLVANPHPAIKYVIFDRKIWSKAKASKGWREYTGRSAHKKHLHVSVGQGPDGRSTGNYDNTSPWGIAALAGKPSQPSKPSKPTNPTGNDKLGDKMPTIQRGNKGSRVRILQGLLIAWHYNVKVDGVFGPKTETAVRSFQGKYAKPVDGIVGRVTWNRLLGL